MVWCLCRWIRSKARTLHTSPGITKGWSAPGSDVIHVGPLLEMSAWTCFILRFCYLQGWSPSSRCGSWNPSPHEHWRPAGLGQRSGLASLQLARGLLRWADPKVGLGSQLTALVTVELAPEHFWPSQLWGHHGHQGRHYSQHQVRFHKQFLIEYVAGFTFLVLWCIDLKTRNSNTGSASWS